MTADASSFAISCSSPQSTRIRIRHLRLNELQAVAEVITHSFHSCQGVGLLLYPLLKLGIHEDIRLRVSNQNNDSACLVAMIPTISMNQAKETLVGAVELSRYCTQGRLPQPQQATYISNLAVSPNYRRQGIARQLLKSCEQMTAQWGRQNIFLHVLENNHQAQRLYEQCGYQLYRVEPSLTAVIFNQPRQLLLKKSITNVSHWENKGELH